MSIEAPVRIEDLSHTQGRGEWIVVVYNNEVNTFDEVTEILMRATGCPMEEAEMETWEIHHLGRSVVHWGGREECGQVAEIIATIGIRVEVLEERVEA
jgi:ATP-dependent Clp protease adaptor protein ClpS